MKTTVDITDSLLEQAKRAAEHDRTTLRALIEEGLRRVLEARGRKQDFRLRRVTLGGQGIDPEVAGWEEVRRRSYEGRGG